MREEPQRYRTPPGQAGYTAKMHGFALDACIHPEGSAEREEWELGWDRAGQGWPDWMTPPQED